MIAFFLDADRLGLGAALEHVGSSAELLVFDHLYDVTCLKDVAEGVFDHAWANLLVHFFDSRFFPFMAADHAFELIRVLYNIVHCAEWAGSIRHGLQLAEGVTSFKF